MANGSEKCKYLFRLMRMHRVQRDSLESSYFPVTSQAYQVINRFPEHMNVSSILPKSAESYH